MARYNYLGLTGPESEMENARYHILPVPYEATVTYGQGAEYGPNAILTASQEVELFDEELGFEPFRSGIYTAPPVEITDEGVERQNEILREEVSHLLKYGHVPCLLGGEHSVSYGSVVACLEKYPDLTILQFDAHADLRDGYLGQEFSHAAIMRRIRDITSKTVSVGIRSYSAEEDEYIKANNVKLFSAANLTSNPGQINEVLEQLSGDLYITFDVDAFDPSLMPATGTPEPGGLQWYPTMQLLKSAIEKCNLVGFDVVELAPIADMHAPDFVAARLIYKIIAYDAARQRR
jgi:agmatinase